MQEQRETRNSGEELAKVLYYYGLIPDVQSSEYKIVCPFHQDINPSMKINLEDGSFFCFGCAATGNAMEFVKRAETDKNDLQAGIEFYKILKSDKVKHIKTQHGKRKPKHQDKHLWNVAYDFYYGLRTVDWLRDKEPEIVEAGSYMRKRGFKRSTLSKCKAKVTYNKNYPIVFPMIDNGLFKGWVCRTTDKEIEAKRKYLYNEGFARRTTLVGEYEGKKTVVLVEGYMDRLKLLQFGVNNAVAILGWKITQEQIQKLKRAGVKTIISALDNDECGIKGTEYLKNFFCVKRFAYDADCKDPGAMTQKTFERMKRNTQRNKVAKIKQQ